MPYKKKSVHLEDQVHEKMRKKAFLDNTTIEKVVNDILKTFPVGTLPPTESITQRDPKEIEPYIKGPLNGGKSIYELRYPP